MKDEEGREREIGLGGVGGMGSTGEVCMGERGC